MSMIACLHCKTVVWAYDHEPRPLAGVMNGMKMPCPECGDVACFDGWNGNLSWEDYHRIAEAGGLTWKPDGECRWFGERTAAISAMLKGQAVPIGVAQPGPTGYDGGDYAEPCLICGAGASAHLCPAVTV